MTQDLRLLESDVEAARRRLAADVSLLREPGTLSEFSSALKHEAEELKNSVVDQVTTNASSAVTTVVDDIKARVAANPAAALAIGAGIAWRLARHPPVTTTLLGLGIYGLCRTSGDQNVPRDTGEYVRTAAANLTHQMADAGQTVAGIARQRGAELEHQLEKVAARTGKAVTHAAGVAEQNIQSLGEKAMEPETRDTILLGLAGAAVAAALSLSLARREDRSGG